jgi:Rrf2 family iron-sulfur cluster assembly transcriptional regulator
MKVSRKADYAMRAALYIARQPKEKRNPINAIADSESIPRDFLAKILKELTRADILRSYQGVHGGYTLARAPRQINLLDIVEAMDGPLGLDLCVRSTNGCDRRHPSHVAMNPFFSKLQAQARSLFKSANLAKLSNGTKSNRG